MTVALSGLLSSSGLLHQWSWHDAMVAWCIRSLLRRWGWAPGKWFRCLGCRLWVKTDTLFFADDNDAIAPFTFLMEVSSKSFNIRAL